jgi:hypothetical protein
MHIFIDESGGFIPLNQKRSRISAVAALVVPSGSSSGEGSGEANPIVQKRIAPLHEETVAEFRRLLHIAAP